MLFYIPSTDITFFFLAQRRCRTCFPHSLTTELWERKCAEYMATVGPVFYYPWKGQSRGFIRQQSLCLDSAVCIQMNLSETSKQSHTKICTDWNGLQFKATTVHTEISQKHLRFGVHLPTRQQHKLLLWKPFGSFWYLLHVHHKRVIGKKKNADLLATRYKKCFNPSL